MSDNISKIKAFINSGAFDTYLYFIAICSSYLSYSCYKTLLPGTEGKVIAAVLSLALAIGLYLFHSISQKVLTSDAEVKNRLVAMVIILLFFCTGVVGFSSGPNVAGIAGKKAQEVHLEKHLSHLSKASAATYSHSIELKKFLPLLKQEGLSWKQAAEDELKEGSYSGFASSGAVNLVLTKYANQFELLHQEAETFISEATELNKTAKRHLGDIRSIFAKRDAIEKRIQDALEPTNELQTLMSQMRGQVLAQSISFAVESLPGEIDLITLSNNPRVAQGQRQAINKIKSKLNRSTELLSRILDEYSELDSPEFPTLKPISTLNAVFLYWKVFPTAWLAGVGLDALPLTLFILILVLDCGRSQKDRAHEKLLNTTADDIFTVQEILDASRRRNDTSQAMNEIITLKHGLVIDKDKKEQVD